jgi:hypothetical protein
MNKQQTLTFIKQIPTFIANNDELALDLRYKYKNEKYLT